MSTGQTGHKPGGVLPKFFMFIGFFLSPFCQIGALAQKLSTFCTWRGGEKQQRDGAREREIYIYIYIYISLSVVLFVGGCRERERDRQKGRERVKSREGGEESDCRFQPQPVGRPLYAINSDRQLLFRGINTS